MKHKSNQEIFNQELMRQAKQRRAIIYRLHLSDRKKNSATNLAAVYGISRQRMSLMLKKAKEDL